MEILEIKNLKTYFYSRCGLIKAVDGVSLSLTQGDTVCLLGESGSGKTVTAHSVLGIVDSLPGIISGEIIFENKNLLSGINNFVKINNQTDNITIYKDIPGWQKQHKSNLKDVRGKRIGYISQDPISSLHPMLSVGSQITETLIRNNICEKKNDAHKIAIEWLKKVKLSEREMASYPFQLSGGMAQRVMIAIALCTNPGLLIADEPTTALDAATQMEILFLLKNLQETLGLTILLITHDIAIAGNFADNIAVMHSGKIVDYGEKTTPVMNRLLMKQKKII